MLLCGVSDVYARLFVTAAVFDRAPRRGTKAPRDTRPVRAVREGRDLAGGGLAHADSINEVRLMVELGDSRRGLRARDLEAANFIQSTLVREDGLRPAGP